MASSNSSYLEVASGHSNSLISYVLDVKPYHTKLSEIVEEYVFGDDIDVKITEDESLLAFLGADILPTAGSAVLGVRKRRSNSWHRDVASDGSRNVWEVPLTSVHKFMSHASQEKFIADGVQDLGTIPGLATGVFNPRRWDGPGITNVKLDGTHQQEAVDYFLSHGAYSFEIRPGQRWKELDQPVGHDFNRDRREDKAHQAGHDVDPGLPHDSSDPAGGGQRQPGSNANHQTAAHQHGKLPDMSGFLGIDHDGRDRSRAGKQWDRQGNDGDAGA